MDETRDVHKLILPGINLNCKEFLLEAVRGMKNKKNFSLAVDDPKLFGSGQQDIIPPRILNTCYC